jgi:hypothetical protein
MMIYFPDRYGPEAAKQYGGSAQFASMSGKAKSLIAPKELAARSAQVGL